MFKTISAAVLAASVLAAPAFAATANTAPKPATQNKVTATAPAKTTATANVGKHHSKYARHHRRQAELAAKPVHHAKVSYKHTAPTKTKRG